MTYYNTRYLLSCFFFLTKLNNKYFRAHYGTTSTFFLQLQYSNMICLFLSLEFFVPFKNFLLISRRHVCQWRAAHFDLCSVLWPFSPENSLAYHTYCDTGHPFIMIITEDKWHSHLMPSVQQWGVINDLGLSRLGIEHPAFRIG